MYGTRRLGSRVEEEALDLVGRCFNVRTSSYINPYPRLAMEYASTAQKMAKLT